MNTLITILVLLFLGLLVLVPVLEKFSKKDVGPKVPASITRLIFPLLMVAIVVQLLFYLFR